MKTGEKMSIKEKIKDRIKECMKSGESEERDILRTVLGEMQSKEAINGDMSEEECIKVFKKFKQGVEDTIGFLKERCASDDVDIREILEMEKEIAIYDQYIPQTMNVEYIVDTLDGYPVIDDIRLASSDGQAVGAAMRFFKQNPNFEVQGKDVSEAVKILRKGNK